MRLRRQSKLPKTAFKDLHAKYDILFLKFLKHVKRHYESMFALCLYYTSYIKLLII